MKIVLITPALSASAIGRMAAMVSRSLNASGHLVTVVRAEAEQFHSKSTHDFGVPLVSWTERSAVEEALSGADLVVHQIGNNYEFHVGNLEWLDHAACVVSLHDFYLGHLFFHWAQTRPEDARAILVHWYGAEAGEAFFNHARSARFLELTSDAMPMTEWICSRATAVITHSSWGVGRVLNACAGPVWTIPLAYDICPGDHPGSHHVSKAVDEVALLTVGHVNANKRIDSVLRAIGSSEMLRSRITYRVVGLVEPQVLLSLTSLARTLDVRLVVVGEVEDDVLSDAFADADIVSCLRWPSLESASASAVEAMLHGKAILVTDTAFYSELPDDCVIKIDPQDEEEQIRAALERLCEEPGVGRDMGDRARNWASGMFSAENYARRLVDMAIPLSRMKWLRRGVEPFAGYLTGWGGAASLLDSPLVTEPLRIITV
jgi:glycosyltransferase involved in cell wall biosynthesis